MKKCIINVVNKDNFDVIELDGALDSHSFPRLEVALTRLQKNNRFQVILDCTHLEYISSVALGALIGFSRKANENNGRLLLANVPSKIESIIKVLGFDTILSSGGTLDETITLLDEHHGT